MISAPRQSTKEWIGWWYEFQDDTVPCKTSKEADYLSQWNSVGSKKVVNYSHRKNLVERVRGPIEKRRQLAIHPSPGGRW